MNFKEENIEAILEGMRGVTSESGGTAYSTFRNFNIEVGGKTGSAQTGVQDKQMHGSLDLLHLMTQKLQ